MCFCSHFANVFRKGSCRIGHITLMWSAIVDLESQSSVNILQYGMSFLRAWPLTSGSRSSGLDLRSSVRRWTGLYVSSSCANSSSSAGRMKFELYEKRDDIYSTTKLSNYERCVQQNQHYLRSTLVILLGRHPENNLAISMALVAGERKTDLSCLFPVESFRTHKKCSFMKH